MKNKVFWEPSISSLEKTNIFNFQNSVNQKYGLDLDSYSDLYNWSQKRTYIKKPPFLDNQNNELSYLVKKYYEKQR